MPLNQIKSRLHQRVGAAPTNFPVTLLEPDSDLARQLVKDPYNFEFLGLTGRVSERALEDALISRISQFLLELGAGFALYGRQYRFDLGDRDFSMDLVFFNVTHARFVIVELKAEPFDPAHLGQLQFYVEWAERHLRQPEHRPTVGILLVADKNEPVVRYALVAAKAPMAVATYTYDTLPAEARGELPAADELTQAVTAAHTAQPGHPARRTAPRRHEGS